MLVRERGVAPHSRLLSLRNNSSLTLAQHLQAGRDEDDEMADVCTAFSRILLKGERYQAPAGLQHAELLEDWSWHGSAHEYCPIRCVLAGAPLTKQDPVGSEPMLCRYLDASCLLFGANHDFLEVVDYQRKSSTARVGPPGAVTHSGDRLQVLQLSDPWAQEAARKEQPQNTLHLDRAAERPALTGA